MEANKNPSDGKREGRTLEECGPKANESTSRIIAYSVERVKWKRSLELALDAVLEAESGDLALVAKNLLEAATMMLLVASEIRGRLRQ